MDKEDKDHFKMMGLGCTVVMLSLILIIALFLGALWAVKIIFF